MGPEITTYTSFKTKNLFWPLTGLQSRRESSSVTFWSLQIKMIKYVVLRTDLLFACVLLLRTQQNWETCDDF